MSGIPMSAFEHLKPRPEDYTDTQAISLDGSIIPEGIPEEWIHLINANQKIREVWDGTRPYHSDSERAFAIANHAGFHGLTKEKTAAVLKAFYAEPGRKNLHKAKLEHTLGAWEEGRQEAQKTRGASPLQTQANVEHLTDMGNAQRFATQHGPSVRYCHPWGKWLVWKQAYWGEDDTGEVLRLAKETIKRMYAEAEKIPDDKQRQAHANHALKCESEGRLKAMLALAQSEPGIPVLPDDLDKDPWLLNVTNGTLDLKTGESRPHRREDWITKLIPVAYDPQAQCPTFLAFLAYILAGNQRLITFLQRAIGYALTGDIREQTLFLLHGIGANGKTTLLETLLGLLSGYARKTRSETLLIRRSDGIPNDIARLRGARFVATVEAEEGRRFAESLLKELTGGDTLSARFMRAEFFEFRPEFKLFMAFNHKPTIRGTDLAIWRRIRLIPFTVVIPEEEQDKEMLAKLQAEWPGILQWAVEGCMAWQREGLKPPPEVLEATAQYREEMDALAGFIEECCEIGESYQVDKGRLYERYTEWCRDNDELPIQKKAFGSRLKERGVTDGRTKGVRFWVGVTMTNRDAVFR